MLIRSIVYAQLLLPAWICEDVLKSRINFSEELRCRKTLDKDGVAPCNDSIAKYVGIGVNKAIETLVDEAKTQELTWKKILQAVENELGRQLCDIDNGVTLLLARGILALLTLRALIFEGEGRSSVLEWLVVVANVSWHLTFD